MQVFRLCTVKQHVSVKLYPNRMDWLAFRLNNEPEKLNKSRTSPTHSVCGRDFKKQFELTL